MSDLLFSTEHPYDLVAVSGSWRLYRRGSRACPHCTTRYRLGYEGSTRTEPWDQTGRHGEARPKAAPGAKRWRWLRVEGTGKRDGV